jgi:DNA relaxase NicK
VEIVVVEALQTIARWSDASYWNCREGKKHCDRHKRHTELNVISFQEDLEYVRLLRGRQLNRLTPIFGASPQLALASSPIDLEHSPHFSPSPLID